MLAGAAATSVAASSNIAEAGTSRHGITFQRVLDAVEDLGMDPTGSEPIDDALDGAIESDTLIEFPPGEYLFSSDRTYYDLTNFGIRGTGSSMDDVVIKPPRYEGYEFLRVERGTNALIENLTLDQRDTIPEWSSLVIDVSTGAELHDIKFAGFNPSDDPPEQPTTSTPQNPIRFHQQNSDGVSNLTGIIKDGPSDIQPYPNGHSCLFFGSDLYGEVNVRDCYIANMSSHSMYGTSATGSIRVENCVFENNNGANCRVSGDGAVVRNCTIIIDVDNAHPDNIYPDDVMKYPALGTGIWTVSQTDPPQNGGLIEDTEIICRSTPNFDGSRPWLIECDGSAGRTVYRNVNIHSEADGHGLVKALDTTRISLPAGFPDDQSVVFDGVTITGNSSGSGPAIDVHGRDATVQDGCLDISGDRDGIGIQPGANNGASGTISDTNINVGGRATIIDDAYVETTNLTYDQACSTDSTSDPNNDYDHSLRVMADPGASVFEYAITVSGGAQLDTSGDFAATPEQDGVGEAVTANEEGTYTITGIVADGGGDSFRFDGEILAADLGGPGTVYVDGSAFDLGSVPTVWNPTKGFEHSLRVVAESGADAFEYSLRTTGEAELDTSGDYAATPEQDGVGEAVTANDDGTYTITGIVADGSGDSFRFDGRLIDVDVPSAGSVSVDGATVDLSTIGLTNTLTVMGAGTELTSYEATVSGDIASNLEADSFNTADSISGPTASGEVNGSTDSYVFSGSISSFELDGTAGVYVNGVQVDPEVLGSGEDATLDHLIEIDGRDSQSDYEFEVTGEVEVSPDAASVESSDSVRTSAVDGTVEDDVDAFRFSGTIERLLLDGTADISFENGG